MAETDLHILLIVTRENARLIHEALAPQYLITEAPSPQRGLEICESSRPDCVLLDTALSEASGGEILEKLTTDVHTPVVALTQSGDEHSAKVSMERGAQAFLPKDALTPDRLRRVVAHVLRYTELKRELEETQGDLRFFSTTMENELQAPLRRMVQLCRDLRESSGERLEEPAARDLGALEEVARGLSVNIARFLEYSTVGEHPPMQAVDLNRVIRRVLANLQASIERTGAHIEGEPLPTVLGDKVSLTRLLQNLMGNAIKFCGAGSPVIRVGSRRKGDMWEISVQDNGVGLDLSQKSAIFAPSKRIQGLGQYLGNGLGLATCKKIVRRHGGRIRVYSEPGQGSLFRFTLPAAAVEAPARAG